MPGKGPKKSAAVLMAENRLLRRFRTTEGIASVLNNLIRWGAVVAIARYGYLTVARLAGQSTFADIGVSFLADVRVSEAVAWILAGSGALYGAAQRRLRRNTVERIQRRNHELEQAIDPKRSSSRLTIRGETRPEDLP